MTARAFCRLVGCVVFVGVIGGQSATVAEQPINILPPDPGMLMAGGWPSIVATPEGFGVAWWDFRKNESGCDYHHGRLALFDAEGHLLGGKNCLRFDSPSLLLSKLRLEAIASGFVVLLQPDMSRVFSVRTDASGVQRSESILIRESAELHSISSAVNDSTIAVVYPDRFQFSSVWSEPLDRDGEPYGPRLIVAGISTGGEMPPSFVYESQVARDGSQFVTAWTDTSLGLRLRELSHHGVPTGDIVSVRPSDGCASETAVAALERGWLVLDSSGCHQTDLSAWVRGPHGDWLGPLLVAADPELDEGFCRHFWSGGLRAAAAADRVGVLFREVRLGGGSPTDVRWKFVELDSQGLALGAVRDLTAEFNLVPVYPDTVEIRWDAYRARYLIVWPGQGPTGHGIWVLPVASRPD